MTVRPLSIPTPKGDVSAVWHPADGPALVVGHGAGAGMDHPFIVGFCEAVADEGVAALRFNFPYMEAGRRTPDQAKNAIGAFRSAFGTASERSGGRPVLGGGKSYGGRIAFLRALAEGRSAGRRRIARAAGRSVRARTALSADAAEEPARLA